jgi:hypothetical protein
VESQPPSRPTPPPPPGGTSRAAESGAPAAARSTASPAGATARVCPACNEPRAADARYCEECGYDYGSQPLPDPPERPFLTGPLLWLLLAFWLAVAVAGLWFLYTVLWAA